MTEANTAQNILKGARTLISNFTEAAAKQIVKASKLDENVPFDVQVKPSRAEIKAGKKDELAKLVEEHKLQFVYVRNSDPFVPDLSSRGGMVIAYRPLLPSGNIVEISTSLCNKKDSFDKVEGKLLAARNFAAGEKIKVSLLEKKKYSIQLHNMFEPTVTLYQG